MRDCGSRAGNGSVALYHLCAPERIRHQVSHVSPLLVVATPSHFSRTTARSTTWTARPSRRHRTPRTTSSRAPTKNFSKQSESNDKESLSDPNCDSGRNLRPNTPTGMSPSLLRPERLRQFRQFLEVLLKIFINEMMCRENLENKINKLQLLKK